MTITRPERELKYACTDELLTNRTYYITHYEFDDENLSDYGCLKCFLSHFGQNWWHDEMEAILMEGSWCLRLKKTVPAGTWCEACCGRDLG